MLTVDQRLTNLETRQHMELIRNLLNLCVIDILRRGEAHDQSKLESPEVEAFTEFTSRLSGSTFGSPEYNSFRESMKPALEHHYANNAHHPEHFPEVTSEEINRLRDDIGFLRECEDLPNVMVERLTKHLERHVAELESSLNNMSLLDIVEMIVDWKASSKRHANGNILKSISVNTDRFKMSPQLVSILTNTVKMFENI